jgi:hypothetical protein
MGCYEIRYTRLYSFIGYPGDVFLSPKNSTSCTAVGGTPTPYYDWHSGTWVSGTRVCRAYRAACAMRVVSRVVSRVVFSPSRVRGVC